MTGLMASKAPDGGAAEEVADPAPSIVLDPSESDLFFNFLHSRTVSQLRARLKYLTQLQHGRKADLALRMFAAVWRKKNEGEKWLEEGGAEYKSWIGDPARKLSTWKRAPGSDVISKVDLRANEGKSVATPFTAAYFFRLCVFLTQDESVRSALLASGQNLTRRDLDVGRHRDALWTDLVAPKFNVEALQLSVPALPIFSVSLESDKIDIAEIARTDSRACRRISPHWRGSKDPFLSQSRPIF